MLWESSCSCCSLCGKTSPDCCRTSGTFAGAHNRAVNSASRVSNRVYRVRTFGELTEAFPTMLIRDGPSVNALDATMSRHLRDCRATVALKMLIEHAVHKMNLE